MSSKTPKISPRSGLPNSRRSFLTGAAATATGIGMAAAAGCDPAPGPMDPDGNASPGCRDFEGKTAFVTGGARGIGLGTAKELARAGANIVLYDVAQQIDLVRYPLATAADLEAARAEIEELGVGCLAIQGDVRDGAKQAQAMAQAVEAFGSIDFIIVNAGVTQLGPLDLLSDDEIALVLDINLAGAMKTIKAAAPFLREQNSGRVVLVSSVTGRGGTAFFPVYSASKWALIGLTKGTAEMLGPHNVTVNAVCPDIVRTGLLENDYILGTFSPDDPTWEAFDAVAQQAHPLPVGGLDPSEVGRLIAFICSEEARYISADVFDIQAGSNFQNLG